MRLGVGVGVGLGATWVGDGRGGGGAWVVGCWVTGDFDADIGRTVCDEASADAGTEEPAVPDGWFGA